MATAHNIMAGQDGNRTPQILRVNANGTIENVPQSNVAPKIFYRAMIESGTLVLAAPTAIGSALLSGVDVTGLTVGSLVEIHENGGIGFRWLQAFVTAVNSGTNVLTLDQQLDYVYPSGAAGAHLYWGTDELVSTTGTVANPVIARMHNLGMGVKWDISVVNLHIEEGAVMADGTFGNLTKLTNGCMFRKISPSGVFPFYNSVNIKDNHTIIEYADRVNVSAKAGGGTNHGLTAKKHLGTDSHTGAIIRIDPDELDQIQFLIQDNLTGIESLHVTYEGSFVTD